MREITMSYSQQKRSDTMVTYFMTLYDDGTVTPLSADNTYRMMITCDGSLVTPTGIELKIEDNQLVLDSNQLNLPAGVYRFEIWVEHGNDKAIYPDNGMKRLEINQNATDLPAGEVSSMTLDEFISKFKEMVKQSGGGSDVQLDVANRTITVDDKIIQIPNEVDLSNVVTKDDLATRLSQYAKTSDIDLTPYLKTADADSKYATQAELSNYATNASVEEKTKNLSVKGIITTDYGTFVQHEPTSIRVIREYHQPGGLTFMLFDNGAELHIAKEYADTVAAITGGFNNNTDHIDQDVRLLRNKVYVYMAGAFTLHSNGWSDRSLNYTKSASWIGFTGCTVKHPYNDSSKYVWDNAHFTNDESAVVPAERDLIKAWYEVGIFNDEEVTKYCHVVPKEGN